MNKKAIIIILVLSMAGMGRAEPKRFEIAYQGHTNQYVYDTNERGCNPYSITGASYSPAVWYDSLLNRTYMIWRQRAYDEASKQYGIEMYHCFYDHNNGTFSDSYASETPYPKSTDVHAGGSIIISNNKVIVAQNVHYVTGGATNAKYVIYTYDTNGTPLYFSGDSLTITDINAGGTYPRISTLENHNLSNGDNVYITNIPDDVNIKTGTVPAIEFNEIAIQAITVVDDNTFDCSGFTISSYSGSYTSGATCRKFTGSIFGTTIEYPHLYKVGSKIYLNGQTTLDRIALYNSGDDGATWSSAKYIVQLAATGYYPYNSTVFSADSNMIRIVINEKNMAAQCYRRIYYLESPDSNTWYNLGHTYSQTAMINRTVMNDNYLIKDSGSDTINNVINNSYRDSTGKIYFLKFVWGTTYPTTLDCNVLVWDGVNLTEKKITPFSDIELPDVNYLSNRTALNIVSYGNGILNIYCANSISGVKNVELWKTTDDCDTWIFEQNVSASNTDTGIATTGITANASVSSPLLFIVPYIVDANYSDLFIFLKKREAANISRSKYDF